MESGPFTSALLLGPPTALRRYCHSNSLTPHLRKSRGGGGTWIQSSSFQGSAPNPSRRKRAGSQDASKLSSSSLPLSTGTFSRGSGSADHDPCKDPYEGSTLKLKIPKWANIELSCSFLPSPESEARREELLPGVQRVSVHGVSASLHCWVLAYPRLAPAGKTESGGAESKAPGLNMWAHLDRTAA